MTASLQETVDDLARRLAVVEGERDVLATLYRYCHSLDYGDDATWVDCFTADGVFEIQLRGADRPDFPPRGGEWTPSGLAYRGRQALEVFVAHHTSAPERYHKHIVVNPRIDVRGDRATVASYIVRLDVGTDDVIFARAFGRYVDRLRREDDGVWRLEHRVAESEAVDLRELRGGPAT